MCAECSTTFRGVNLSKAGVEIRLGRERAAEEKKSSGRVKGTLLAAGSWLLVVPALWLLQVGWSGGAVVLARMLRTFALGDDA